MKISFKDKVVRNLCEKRAEAQKKLGDACASKLRLRLAELEAARCVTALAAGRPHPLTGDRLGQFSLDLARGWRLVFAPDNDPVPTKADGSIDWAEVTLICIEYIGDYHD